MKSHQNKKNTPRQSKYFCLLLYTEWSNLLLLLDHISSISKYFAYIQHDKDVDTNNQPKKIHIHLVLETSAKRTINGLYQIINSPCLEFTSNLIQICDNLNGAVRYLTHIDYPEKYQYNYDDIVTNDSEWLYEHYQKLLTEQSALKIITDYIKNSHHRITMMNIYDISVDNNCLNTYARRNGLIKNLVFEHNSFIDDENTIQNRVDRETVKAIARIEHQNSITAKLVNTFDKINVQNDDGEIIEIMKTGIKKS